ncbi:skin secretory protein xP2 isoform X2 [Lucilia cuprina]|uniref:skin secretory protein xP2 isoform X2 n=1 Tax=Lucilia cuprina TaxID=7375 RepID=UPI000C718DC1|nr:skin secretory protein xP2 isoform X2 [Lucilia cuprina]
MKFSATLALAVIVGLVASSSAFPAQKRAEALVAGETVATGTYLEDCDHAEGDVTAAGPGVAFEASAPVDIVAEHGEDVLSEAHGVHATQAEAEAYPVADENVSAFEVPADVDIVAEENEVSDDAAKVPRDFNLDGADDSNAAGAGFAHEEVAHEVPAVEAEATFEVPEAPVEAPLDAPVEAPVEAAVAHDLPVPAPIAPVAKPVNRYLPAKKKVYVELDQSVESAEDTGLVAASEEADEEEEEEHVAPVAPVTRRPARRPSAGKKPSKAAPAKKEQKPLPVGTFFPINFGGTKGGAIAIANSFSTGEGGSATSHAIAYGSPDAAALRGCVTCKKH